MIAIGYTRVSSERQANEDRTSLADQRAAIVQLAASLGLSVAQWFEDGGKSGTSAEKRPAFTALVSFCRAHPGGVVLVLNDSRFGRFPEPDEAGYWRTELRRVGWEVRYAENDDARASLTARHLMRAIGDAGASEYIATLKRNIRRGVRGTAEQGFWRTRSPFGYARQVINNGQVLGPGQHKHPEERVRLVPDHNAPLVREMFQRYAMGNDSLASLGRWLVTVSGDRQWQYPAQVRWILGNRTYLGEIDTAGVIRTGAHEPLVDRGVFAAAERRLVENRAHTRRIAADYALSGVLRCAVCDHHFIGGGWRGGGTERRPYYVDAGSRYHACPGKAAYLSKAKLESVVVGIFADQFAQPDWQQTLERELDAALTAAQAARRTRPRTAQLEAERKRLVSAIGKGIITEEEASSRLAEIRDALAAPVAAIPTHADRDFWLELAADFPRVVAMSSGNALRELLQPWLGGMTYDKRTRDLAVTIEPAAFGKLVPANWLSGPRIQRVVSLRGVA